MHRRVGRFLTIIAIAAAVQTLQAGSAKWKANPTSTDWSLVENWRPATVPYGETDVATFGVSNTTSVLLGDAPNGTDADNMVGGIVYPEGASAYSITLSPTTETYFPTILIFYGDGITNSSGATQTFVAARSSTKNSARIYFMNNSSAGENVVITNEGGDNTTGGEYGAFTQFGYGAGQAPSAGKATFINEGGMVGGTIYGGFTNLGDSTRAESATFINNPGVVSGAGAGHTLIQTQGDLGTSTFINNAATVPGAEGGWTEIDFGTTSGSSFIANGASLAGCQGGQVYAFGAGYGTGEGLATYTAKGGDGSGAEGGLIDVLFVPANAQTIVVANGGTNGGLGGTILIEDSADIPLPQFQVNGNGVLDLANVSDQVMPIGSIAGDGIVLLAGHDLNVGNNNLNTTFSGVIQEDGSLSKAGTGTLTLSGRNTYTGGTTVSGGVLLVNRSGSSGTGTGPVTVNAGTLGGNGTIAGAVTVGTGNGAGAFLAPGQAATNLITLRIQSALTLKADATYSYRLSTRKAKADQVVAKGVTIENGAQFQFLQVGNKQLTSGTVFTAINNTSANPISGTFADLPDNSTFTAGHNNYQVSYEGGDGNDLTLTVVP